MKLLLLPFTVVVALDIAMFALARIARRLSGKRTAEELVSFERREALHSPHRVPARGVSAPPSRKHSRTFAHSASLAVSHARPPFTTPSPS